VRVDARQPGALAALQSTLGAHRPGGTPIRVDLVRDGARGSIELNGPQGVRVGADLASLLKANPGVRGVAVAFSKPWAN